MKETFTKPFKGILYNKENTDNISSIVCPPYDVISDNEIYYEKSDVNAIRLELPKALPAMDQYAAAKQTMDDWLKKGVLLPDKENTVYVYEQEFEIESVSFFRRGFIALHKLSPERILTHEETRKKAKADREQLISTLKTYTSLIFGLYEDKDEKIEVILAESPKEKIYDFTDEQAVHNRFYRMTDGDAIARLVSIMDTKNIYIADGHHRLGVSYKGIKNLNINAGYMYQPSPIPNQSGKVSNYIDLDKNIFSLGAGYQFKFPWDIFKQPLKVEGVLQYQELKEITVIKDGVTGKSWVNQVSYEVKGNSFAAGLNLNIAW